MKLDHQILESEQQTLVRFVFPKFRRILKGAEFVSILRQKDRQVSRRGPILMIAVKGSYAWSRLGLIVARRHVRSAVLRNRFKRVAREQFRLGVEKHHPRDVVMRVAAPLQDQHWESLQAMFLQLYKNIEKE